MTFSYDENHNLEFTNSAMRYYCQAPPNADLSYRYEAWTKRPEAKPRLDGLLRALLRDEVAEDRKKANIVTWRGVMTR